ncbi:hypothetical protein A2797_00640 [candidate division WWE3 bacterium RIFCSPHIGHO2_01_FULL_48_15]|uniref:Lycopene cyclase domain-containing protein n=1 Tax=candidate division WWE3 bacterium RIFCSPHIGHO2_01_FULL_48_15 TaxID=1802619 RepID=A0A1F4VBL9_UNCKA|nr:MAG: hypothetical protein A2797_00640 [candidate division WWE3 bacterium RIFCSPHIGHO2_01_FULL_48_15]
MLGQASHIAYTLIFTLPPLAVAWIFFYRTLIGNWKIITKVVLAYFPLLFIGDIWAISNNVWSFSPEKVTGVWILGASFDDLVFGVMATLVVSSATIVGMSIQDSFTKK